MKIQSKLLMFDQHCVALLQLCVKFEIAKVINTDTVLLFLTIGNSTDCTKLGVNALSVCLSRYARPSGCLPVCRSIA